MIRVVQNRIRPASLLAALLVTLGVRSVEAENTAKKDPWLDTPTRFSVFNTKEPSSLVFSCEDRSKTAPRTIHCVITETTIRRPDPPEKVAQTIAELDALANTPKATNDMRADCLKKNQDYLVNHSPPGAAKDFAGRVAAACKANSPKDYWAAERWYIENVLAKTCSITTWFPFDATFTQIDPNTWQSTVKSTVCPFVTVTTLWREAGERSPALWNYRQVTTAAPNSPEACGHGGETVSEFRWDGRGQLLDLGCSYLAF